MNLQHSLRLYYLLEVRVCACVFPLVAFRRAALSTETVCPALVLRVLVLLLDVLLLGT